MSEQVCEITKAMGADELEKRLALHCAPVIMGLKCANAITTSVHNVIKVAKTFAGSPIRVRLLYAQDGKAVVLLYRKELLQVVLNDAATKELLYGWGYDTDDLLGSLKRLSDHFSMYLAGKSDFPHEVGLFLGYPIEDVLGFMINGGQGAVLTGPWKVYENPEAKQKIFEQYDRARELLVRMADQGFHMGWVAKCYGPAVAGRAA